MRWVAVATMVSATAAATTTGASCYADDDDAWLLGLGADPLLRVREIATFPSPEEWAAIARDNEPVVVRNVPLLESWRTLGDWSPEALERAHGPKRYFPGAYYCNSSDMLYGRSDRPVHALRARKYRPYALVNTSTIDVSTMVRNVHSGRPPFMYFSGSFNGPAKGILPPKLEAAVRAGIANFQISYKAMAPWAGDYTLWLVPAGVVTRTH